MLHEERWRTRQFGGRAEWCHRIAEEQGAADLLRVGLDQEQLGRERTQASRASKHGSESRAVHVPRAARGAAGDPSPELGWGASYVLSIKRNGPS